MACLFYTLALNIYVCTFWEEEEEEEEEEEGGYVDEIYVQSRRVSLPLTLGFCVNTQRTTETEKETLKRERETPPLAATTQLAHMHSRLIFLRIQFRSVSFFLPRRLSPTVATRPVASRLHFSLLCDKREREREIDLINKNQRLDYIYTGCVIIRWSVETRLGMKTGSKALAVLKSAFIQLVVKGDDISRRIRTAYQAME